jgi:hypothetical protein
MKNKTLLWINLFLSCCIFGASMFYFVAIQPNWKSGNVEDLILMNNFFHNSSPDVFFQIFIPLSVLVSLVCTILYRKVNNILRNYLAMVFVINVAVLAFTLLYFVPKNEYLFVQHKNNIDAEFVKTLVSSWMTAQYFRNILFLMGCIFAARSVHQSYLLPQDK